METVKHLEQRHFKIGDEKFYIRLEIEIDRKAEAIEYWIKTSAGKAMFHFANSKPETLRKMTDLIKSAVHTVTKLCKEEGLHIVLLSDEESSSSNGAQGGTPSSA